MHFDHEVFFNEVRNDPFPETLSQSQVSGMEVMLTAWEKHRGDDQDVRFLAYEFATAFHETGATMQPIEEWGKGSGHSYGEIDPETGQAYYGRGLVQLTHRENYARADHELNALFGVMVGMEWDASKALNPRVATGVMFLGMEQGWFTARKLEDYFNEVDDDPVNARQIVNGNDDDVLIASYHQSFLFALGKAETQASKKPADLVIVNLQAPPGITVQVHLNGEQLPTN